MEENETKVIEILPTPCSIKEKEEEKEKENGDCLILDFDPFESINDIGKLCVSNSFPKDDDDDKDEDDQKVMSENGQVACRDYPHSRHLCITYPFDETPNENHCEMCYCHVCDSIAPCKFWIEADDDQQAHCHASENIGHWKSKRKLKKLII